MKRSNDRHYDDELNNFIHDAKTLFGFDEESLLAELEEAEREWEQEQQEHPEEAAKIMQESDGKFEELMRKMEADGVRPAGVTAAEWNELELESDAGWDSFDEDEFYEFEDEGEDDEEYDENEAESIAAVVEAVGMMEEELAAEETAEETATAGVTVEKAVTAEAAVAEVIATETTMAEGTMPELVASETTDSGTFQLDDTNVIETMETVREESEAADVAEENASAVPATGAVASSRKGKAKPVRFRKRKKALLLVAAVAVMGLGTTLVAHGNREYKLRQYPVEAEKNVTIYHNSVIKMDNNGKLYDAYEEIKKKLEIDVVKLCDMPEHLQFKQLLIYKNRAVIEFKLNDKSIYYEASKVPAHQESTSVIISDRKNDEAVYNEWLNQDVIIESNVLENGETEYSAGFVVDDTYYYLSGVMAKTDFVTLVKGASH